MLVAPAWLEAAIDEEIITRINKDPRTIAAPNTFLGWPKNKIFIDVLGFGQANFDATVGHLSPADRALLYARYNQPRHLDELSDAFTKLLANSQYAGRPTILDLGCGPFTAGLAFAACFGPEREFRYFGIDIAASMCDLGARLVKAADRLGGLNARTTCEFGADLDNINFGRIRGDLTIIVASYLLASPTLNANLLVNKVLRALDRIGPGPAAVLFTNSAVPHLNTKYPEFRDALCDAGFIIEVDDTELFTPTKNPKELRYALFFRKARTRITF
jgi:SAM-dependent methyltransferase